MKIYLMLALPLILFHTEVSTDSSIRIPAYVPKPPVVHDILRARRVGPGGSVIEDPHEEHTRHSRPFVPHKSYLRRKIHRRPERSDGGNSHEITRTLDSVSSINPDMLRNPIGTASPVGPPGFSVGGVNSHGVGPPSIHPPSPPFPEFGPPSPPTFPSTVGPPTPPALFLTPSPPPLDRESNVTGIKCIEFDDQKIFQALLTLPSGYDTIPVLEDRTSIDLTTNPVCRVIPTASSSIFNLVLSEFEECGVRKCRQSNGENWNCLIIRFPLINGIKLPEDELVEIRCRPHDKTADDNHILSVATAKYADKSKILSNEPPTVFEGLQEFKCEIGLFRQLPGTDEFTSRITGDDSIKLGEKVQLWSIVKSGDGWGYSRLTEVVILKDASNNERSLLNTLVLVYSDGCRNPNYKVIAENHPTRDRENPLVNKFTFRVFMFQDMEPGDSLIISARVIGCIRREDCQPTVCGDDGIEGYGRKKREVQGNEFTVTSRYTVPPNEPSYPPVPPEGTSHLSVPATEASHSYTTATEKPPYKPVVARASEEYYAKPPPTQNKVPDTTNWSRNLAIRVKMPGEDVQKRSVEFKDCQLYLYISLGIGIVFFIISSTCVAFTTMKCSRNPKKPQPAPNSACHHATHKKPKGKRTLKLQVSSSGSEGNYTTSSTESTASANHLRDLPVPPTVKHRKKKVNTELMNLFTRDDMMQYNSQYPPMMNYYGYMVVPRPQHNQGKKSLRAIKRNANPKIHTNDAYRKRGKKPTDDEGCYCKSTHSSSLSSDDIGTPHKSIIKITSSGANTISSGCRPQPKPRSRVSEPIYNVIRQDMLPTMV